VPIRELVFETGQDFLTFRKAPILALQHPGVLMDIYQRNLQRSFLGVLLVMVMDFRAPSTSDSEKRSLLEASFTINPPTCLHSGLT
jgi:hypothetical protein